MAKIGAEVQAGTLNQRTVKPPIPSIWACAFVKRANKATHRHHVRNTVWPYQGIKARGEKATDPSSLGMPMRHDLYHKCQRQHDKSAEHSFRSFMTDHGPSCSEKISDRIGSALGREGFRAALAHAV